MFRALVLDKLDGKVEASVKSLDEAALPEGEITVAVAYSSLNYKDGLAIADKGKIVRSFPMVPGVDWAGTVESSTSASFKPGDRVILTGWGVGENYWGGMAQKARAQSQWLVKLPAGTDEKWAMGMGTAGLTAMMAVHALEAAGLRRDREILVTGAAGGVGSVAVALLAKLGHKVAASTGRRQLEPYLQPRRSRFWPSAGAGRSTRSAGRRWRPYLPVARAGLPSPRAALRARPICRRR
jgi:acrylyl-CoA reductase (NADPH)